LESTYHLLLKFLAVKDMKIFGEECAKLLDQLFIQPAKEKKKGPPALSRFFSFSFSSFIYPGESQRSN